MCWRASSSWRGTSSSSAAGSPEPGGAAGERFIYSSVASLRVFGRRRRPLLVPRVWTNSGSSRGSLVNNKEKTFLQASRELRVLCLGAGGQRGLPAERCPRGANVGGGEGRTEPRGPGAQRAPPPPWNRSSRAPLSARREKRGQRGGPKQRRHRFRKALGMPSAEGTAAERHGVQELLPAPLCRSVTACLTGLTAGERCCFTNPSRGRNV